MLQHDIRVRLLKNSEKLKRPDESKKQIDVGPKSDSDLKQIFNDLYLGVSKTKERVNRLLCEWKDCHNNSKFDNVELLCTHCKEYLECVDT